MPALDHINKNGTKYEIVPEIAPLFNTSTAYAKGDCAIKDAVLYRFKTAHSAGAWNSSEVDAINVSKEVTDLKEDLSDSEAINFGTITKSLTWINKVVNGTTGELSNTTNANRAVTDPMIMIPANAEIMLTSTASGFNIHKYDASKAYLGSESGVLNIWLKLNGVRYIRLLKTENTSTASSSSALYIRRAEDGYVTKEKYAQEQKTNITKVISGNPVVIDDASIGEPITVTLTGADSSTKTSWSGKNLFRISPDQSSFTKNNVTFSFDKETGRISAESSLGASGTAVSTQATDTLNNKSNMNINFKFVFEEDTIITISSNASQFRPYDAKWYLQITDGTTGYFEDGNGLTITAKAGVEYGIRVIVQTGFITTERLDIYPQVEINDHKTAFEPYAGGYTVGTSAGEANVLTLGHNINGSDSGLTWKLNKSDNCIIAESNGLSSDVVIYDTQLALSHSVRNIYHFTPSANTYLYLSGAVDDSVVLQISPDGTNWYTDSGRGVGLVGVANTEYAVRALGKSGFSGKRTIYPKISTGLSGIIGDSVTVIYTDDDADIKATYTKRTAYNQATEGGDVTKAVSRMTAGSILNPFKSYKPIVTFIDDDTTSLTDVNNYASVFTALNQVGTYAVMTRNVENVSGLKERLLELETAGFGMVFHCEYQEGSETNYFLNDSNRDIELVRENITLGLRQMQTYGFTNYKHWVTPYGVNDKDIVDVAKDYGLESLISMSNNSWVANTGNVSRYNVPRLSVSTSTPSDFPTIKLAAETCLADNGWLNIVTHANTWRYNNVVSEMQTLLTNVIQYLTTAGFEVVPYARAYESRKSVFYMHDLLS